MAWAHQTAVMDAGRRRLLVGAVVALVPLRPARAESAVEREHQAVIDAPALSEDPTAVPVQVTVDHPMVSDHHIRAIEITLDQDPVPAKGKYLFSPTNGQAAMAFQMRSGAGGVLKAVVECSRHGRFTATRQIRVTEGGCTTAPDTTTRTGGNPRLRLPATIRAGELVQVRTKVDHSSHTGLAIQDGKIVRVAPEFYLKQLLVYVDDQKVSEFQLTSAISGNPLFRFPLRLGRSGTVRVVFVNSEGLRWEISQAVRLAEA
jgi:sulfur-oxidizing protein SoxZ